MEIHRIHRHLHILTPQSWPILHFRHAYQGHAVDDVTAEEVVTRGHVGQGQRRDGEVGTGEVGVRGLQVNIKIGSDLLYGYR